MFVAELTGLLNKYNKENGSNTPDFILAIYLHSCLLAFNVTSAAREGWYGVHLAPGTMRVDPVAEGA